MTLLPSFSLSLSLLLSKWNESMCDTVIDAGVSDTRTTVLSMSSCSSRHEAWISCPCSLIKEGHVMKGMNTHSISYVVYSWLLWRLLSFLFFLSWLLECKASNELPDWNDCSGSVVIPSSKFCLQRMTKKKFLSLPKRSINLHLFSCERRRVTRSDASCDDDRLASFGISFPLFLHPFVLYFSCFVLLLLFSGIRFQNSCLETSGIHSFQEFLFSFSCHFPSVVISSCPFISVLMMTGEKNERNRDPISLKFRIISTGSCKKHLDLIQRKVISFTRKLRRKNSLSKGGKT